MKLKHITQKEFEEELKLHKETKDCLQYFINTDEFCVFKLMQKSNGTTFQDVKRYVERENGTHGLYKCVKCNGLREDFGEVNYCYRRLKG